MKILAIMGSYRKGGTIDSVLDKILEGARAGGAETEKIVLADRHIEYCRNCFTCFRDLDADIGRCVIRDDMRGILEQCAAADGLVFGAPVNAGSVTALMKTFIERACFTMSRPTGRFLWFRGVPEPRAKAVKRAVVVTSAGTIPAFLKFLFSYPEFQLAGTARYQFRARVVGSLFISSIQNRRLRKAELKQAYRLGRRLAAPRLSPVQEIKARARDAAEPLFEVVSSVIRL